MAEPAFQFQEQVDFFRQKVNVPTASWSQVQHEEHDRAFMVAGAMRDDLLADFRAAIDKAISKGTTLEEFRADFDSIVAKHGWTYNGGRNWRSKVIYETNLRTSYAAGRWKQIQEYKDSRPYVRYRHNDAVLHPRPLHVSWDGLVLPVDSDWIATHWPPNGWNCGCFIESLSERNLKKLGKSGPDTPPPQNYREVVVGKRGGFPRVVRTPEGVDPGFGYAPGRSLVNSTAQSALDSAGKLPASVGAQSAGQVLALKSVRDSLAKDFTDLVMRTVEAAQPVNDSMIVGALSTTVVEALTAAGTVPEAAPIIARDLELLHALRSTKAQETASGVRRVLTAQELSKLPDMLSNADAVLLDRDGETLIYVFTPDNGPRGRIKVVVRVNYSAKLAGLGKPTFNAFKSAAYLDAADVAALVARGEATVIEGAL